MEQFRRLPGEDREFADRDLAPSSTAIRHSRPQTILFEIAIGIEPDGTAITRIDADGIDEPIKIVDRVRIGFPFEVHHKDRLPQVVVRGRLRP